jgi:hypothetical protein
MSTKKAKTFGAAKNLREYTLPPKESIPKRLYPTTAKRSGKEVNRFTEEVSHKEAKEIVIRKGKGTALENIPNVASKLKSLPKSHSVIDSIYSIVYGRMMKSAPAKKQLGKFSGVVYDDDKGRQHLESKLFSFKTKPLRDVLAFFGQNPEGDKDDLVKRLANFLERPKESDEQYPLSSLKKRKRSTSRGSSKGRSKSPAKKKKKKDPNAPKRSRSSYIFFCKAHRSEVAKKHPKEGITEIAARLGAMWHKASAKEKKEFEDKAKKDKERYAKEMKAYGKKK